MPRNDSARRSGCSTTSSSASDETRLRAIARELGCKSDALRELLRAAEPPVSLHSPAGHEDGVLADVLEDPTAESPFDAASQAVRASTLRQIVSRLSDRERKVIEMRFGLGDQQSSSRQEVGRALDLTSERIRQIEQHTLKKLETLAHGDGIEALG